MEKSFPRQETSDRTGRSGIQAICPEVASSQTAPKGSRNLAGLPLRSRNYYKTLARLTTAAGADAREADVSEAQRHEILKRLYSEAVDVEQTYVACFARFMRSLSHYADSLIDYTQRALFLRVAGEEIGFDPVDFWDVVDRAETRALISGGTTVGK